MKDLIKLLILLPLYCMIGPMIGRWAAQNWQRVRWLFALMMFLPCVPPGKFTLFVWSVEFYRGHTKGYEGNFIEVLAIAIITASMMHKYPGWKKWGPGISLWFLYCAMGAISLIPAMQYSFLYGSMAFVKFTKASLMMLGAYHFVRDEEDLRWALRSMAAPLIYYGWLSIEAKLTGVWQFKGSFEHQNPMAMWIYLTAIPLFAAALMKSTSTRDFILYMAGVGCGGLAVLLSVSRAGLGAYGAGCAVVLLFAWLRKPNARVISITGGAVVMAFLVFTFAFGSFRSRMNEVKESAGKSELDLRDVLNMQSKAMLQDSFIGIGWNCFGVANSRPHGAKYSGIIEDWDASRGFTIIEDNYIINPLTESLYWLHLSETGYPGFVSYVAFEAATLWFALRCALRFKGSLPGVFCAAMLVGLTICYAHGLVERILTQTKNLSSWMLLCGLVIGVEQRRRLVQQLQLGQPLPLPS
jgi:hypothetical protein